MICFSCPDDELFSRAQSERRKVYSGSSIPL